MKQIKNLTFVFLIGCLANPALSQLAFSTDGFKTTIPPSLNMDHQLLKDLSVRIPVNETYKKYDKVVIAFIARVKFAGKSKFFIDYLRRAEELYPQRPDFDDNYGDIGYFTYKLLAPEGETFTVAHSLSKFLKADNIRQTNDVRNYDVNTEYEYLINVAGYYKDGEKYINGKWQPTYVLSKEFLVHDPISFTSFDDFYTYWENQKKIEERSWTTYERVNKLLGFYEDSDPYGCYQKIFGLQNKLLSTDNKTIKKLRNAFIDKHHTPEEILEIFAKYNL